MTFTDRKIKNLKPREKRFVEWEENIHGYGSLGVRVSPTGRKSWVMSYFFGGRPRMLTFGTYPKMTLAQAHKAHGDAVSQLEKGEDPGAAIVEQNQNLRKSPTVNDLADLYLKMWAKPKKRSWKEDQRMLDNDVLPKWGRRKAQNIARRDVIALLDEIVERGAPISANRTLAVIRKMFNFAVSRDILSANPCTAIDAPGTEKRCERVLSETEVKRMLQKLPEANMSELSRLAIRFQLLTAQRCGEVLNAEWNEINLEFGWWTIPSEKSKNKLAHRVPLSTQAKAVLERVKELTGKTQYVFPSPRNQGTKDETPMNRTVLTRAIRRSADVFEMEPWTPHDLRRTAASHMTSMGVSRLVVSKILNHAERGVTAVYDRHSYDSEKREALKTWGLKLDEIKSLKNEGADLVEVESQLIPEESTDDQCASH